LDAAYFKSLYLFVKSLSFIEYMEYVRRNLLLMFLLQNTQCNLVNSLKSEFFEKWDMYCLVIFKSLGDH